MTPARRDQGSTVEGRDRPRRWWIVVALIVVAVAGVATWWIVRPAAAPGTPEIAIHIRRARGDIQGDAANTGDVVEIRARGGEPMRGLWVWRDDRWLMVCPAGDGCRDEPEGLTLSWTARLPGTYRIYYVTRMATDVLPHGNFEFDMAEARRAGAVVESAQLTVR
jgi:hypothetical protein